MSLTRLRNLAAGIEDVPGTFRSAILAASFAQHLVRDASMDFDFPLYERDFLRATLTPLVGLTGMRTARARFSLEMTPPSSGTTPPWDVFLQGCGMASKTLVKVTCSTTLTISGGPLRHGESVTQTAGISGKVALDTYTGATELWLYDTTGSIHVSNAIVGATTSASLTAASGNLATTASAGRCWFPLTFKNVVVTYSGSDPSVGETLTGGTSGAIGIITAVDTTGNVATVRVYNAKMYSAGETLTASSTGSIGTASAPAQADMPSLSLALYEDGVRKAMRGARGNVTLDVRIGEALMLAFDFTGSYESEADAANLSAVTYPLRKPSVFLNAGALLGTEGSTPTYAPRFSTASLNLGNDVQYRESANSTSGILEANIVGRRGTGSIDPELDLEASFPALANFKNGTPGNLRFNVGSTAPSKFIIGVPGMSTTGAPTGDRNGQSTRDLAFNLTGGEFSNASNTPGENNELVIVYAAA